MSSTLKTEPTSAVLGAVAGGVDIANPSPEDIEAIYEALLEYGVLFFRGNLLTDEEQANFASHFGDLSPYPIRQAMGVEQGPPTSVIKDSAESPPKADGWHTDITWLECPPKIAFLQPLVLPERGGDTMWGCMHAAFDAFSPALAEFCKQLTAVHHIGPTILRESAKFGGKIPALLKEAHPPVTHPLIRTHPDTAKQAIFYGGEFMQEICELSDEESEMFLNFLADYVNNPNFHVRWDWEKGDLAMWDERRTIHRGLSYHYPQNREVRRCTVDGDKPFFKNN